MLKRLFDFLASLALLILLSPLFAIIALLIKLDSPGPVFYRARRVGWEGQPFCMLKFRTMVTDADKLGPGLTCHADPRITRVGHLLRQTSLDELPQLLNIVRGDMSLIGPRPETPEYVNLNDPTWQQVLSVRPGLSGLAQLRYADEAAQLSGVAAAHDYLTHILPDKLALDVQYVQTRSLALDLILLFQTLLIALRRSQ